MIGKLTGTIEHILEDSIILNVNGVGYLTTVPAYILHQSKVGDHISLFIETLIRPEMITLYGFKEFGEKILFQKLMSVQGIGGKSAAAILSIMTPDQILESIIVQDAAAFKRADGIGPKVATRILVELKDYASKQDIVIGASHTASASTVNIDDALSTLLQLGYKRHEANQAVHKVAETLQNATTETLVPAALKLLARNIL
jgi:Holliday junction DNA helicase RuvA